MTKSHVDHLTEPPNHNTQHSAHSHVSSKILKLALEIIYLLIGEGYRPSKNQAAWSRSQSAAKEPLPPPAISDSEQKILEVTSKIVELLTGEVPVRCQDVAVYLSMEEREYLEGHCELYEAAMMEEEPPLTSPATEASEDDTRSLVLECSVEDQSSRTSINHSNSKLVSDGEEHHLTIDISTPPKTTSFSTHFIKEESPEDDDVIISKISMAGDHAITEDLLREERSTSMAPTGHEAIEKPLKASDGPASHVQRLDTKRTYQCPQCQKCFTSDCDLSTHQLKHMESQAFICSLSGKYFATSSDLDESFENRLNSKTIVPVSRDTLLYPHLMANEPFQRQNCRGSFEGKSRLATHQQGHLKTPYTCPECGRNFLSKAGLISHQKTHPQEKEIGCPICGKTFMSRASLFLHQKVHVEKTASEKGSSFEEGPRLVVDVNKELVSCSECGESFEGQLELAAHRHVHLKMPYTCPECGRKFLSKSGLVTHQKTHSNQKEQDCPKRGKNVLLHQEVHVDRKSNLGSKKEAIFDGDLLVEIDESFSCSECGESFDDKLDLASHQQVHLKMAYPCLECGRNFLSKSGLVTHQKTHSDQKEFDCPMCGKSFLSRANLLLHQEIHADAKLNLCLKKESSFEEEPGLVMHQGDEPFPFMEDGEIFDDGTSFLQSQSSSNTYVCSECGKLFNRKSSLSLHRRVIHQGHTCFSCPVCGKGFSCQSELVRHARVHTGEQPYSCPQCKKCFSFKSALVRHQRIHTGSRPHNCSVCSKSFSCNSALLRHQAVHFKNNVLL